MKAFWLKVNNHISLLNQKKVKKTTSLHTCWVIKCFNEKDKNFSNNWVQLGASYALKSVFEKLNTKNSKNFAKIFFFTSKFHLRLTQTNLFHWI